jgi:hypothetical protein
VGNLAVDHLFPGTLTLPCECVPVYLTTWYRSLCVAEWDIWTRFISDYTTTGLSLDSLASSHPVEVHGTHRPPPHSLGKD